MKLLRSLPSAWNNIALIMRNKPDTKTLSMDDLYNNLKVYEAEIKGKSSSSSNSHNVAFVSSENTSSINETVNAAHDIPAAGLKEQLSASSYVDDVMFSFFASQLNTPQLDSEDLEQIDTDDLEEMDLKWSGDNERRVVPIKTPASSLVVQNGLGGYEWSYQAEEGPIDFALIAHSSDSANSSNSEVQSCSNEFLQSFKNLQRQYDQQKEVLNKDNLEILAASDSSVSEIDEDNNQAKDRYKVGIRYHAVPHPYTGNYMPPRADLSFAGLHDSVFKFKISETIASVNENELIASKSSEEIKEEPKTVRHMTDNKSFLIEYQEIDGGFVAFEGSPKGGKITKKNRVLVTKPHNKTPYELLIGRSPNLEFMRPFGCPVTILNTLDYLGKFDGKTNEGFLVGYSVNSKAFRVFNSRTRKVEENLHPVTAGNQSNGDAYIQTDIHAGQASEEKEAVHEYILLPFIPSNPPLSSTIQSSNVNAGDIPGDIDSSTQAVNAASSSINTASNINDAGSLNINTADSNHTNMPTLEAIGIFDGTFDDRDLGAEADTNNLDSSTVVSPIPTTRVHNDHPKEQIIRDTNLNTQTKRMINFSKEIAMDIWTLVDLPYGKRAIGSKWVFRNKLDEIGIVIRNKVRLVAQGHTQEEGIDYDKVFASVARKEVIRLFLAYASFKDLIVYQMDVKSAFLYGKRAIGSKWVFRNKLDEIGIVIRNKVRLVAQGHTQEKGIDYDKVFASVVRKEVIRLFLAYASFKDFIVYQMDVKSAFLYGKIEEEVYVCQPPRFKDPDFLDKVYKVKKALYCLHQAPRACQDKYVAKILKKFGFSEVKTASTSMETSKPLLKDEDGQETVVANSTTEAEYVTALSCCR
uniref:Uncharacterized protein n=1 Tax=Tanacetum cinerariifolium TaxID=118510 RepID=A0A6L2LY10_TANCI|nr:hypothetical protein [Tanacetum cinerariifolium]